MQISATINDLKGLRIVIPTTSPFSSPFWFILKTDRTWRMTDDYHDLNQVEALLTSVLPDTV